MANLSLSQLSAKTTLNTADLFLITDSQDTTQGAAGTSKSITVANINTYFNSNLTFITASSTNILTNKTYDTAGTGNVFKINGTAINAITGSGSVVLATSPTLVTPTLGVATVTTINGLAINTTTGTLAISNAKTLTIFNTMGFSSSDGATITFQGTDTYISRTSTDTLTNKTLTSPVINGPTIGQQWDGWITVSDTWTYASATSFTISGVDRTAIFKPGTLLKFTNNSITVYGTVSSSSFSTNTTVNLMTNADYSINNSAITNPQYSYMRPPDFPSAFNYAPSWGGFSANPTGNGRFYTIGRRCFIKLTPSGNGTSNATTLTVSGPVNALQTDNFIGWCSNTDNGSVSTTPGRVASASASSTFNVFKDASNTGWTNTGAKNINMSVDYEF